MQDSSLMILLEIFSVVGSSVLLYSSSSARNSSIVHSSAEKTWRVSGSHFEEACHIFASAVNIERYHGEAVSFRNGIKPATIVLASESFSGRKVKETTFSDCHNLSIVWNRGVPGKIWLGIDIRSCLREIPVFGSG